MKSLLKRLILDIKQRETGVSVHTISGNLSEIHSKMFISQAFKLWEINYYTKKFLKSINNLYRERKTKIV